MVNISLQWSISDKYDNLILTTVDGPPSSWHVSKWPPKKSRCYIQITKRTVSGPDITPNIIVDVLFPLADEKRGLTISSISTTGKRWSIVYQARRYTFQFSGNGWTIRGNHILIFCPYWDILCIHLVLASFPHTSMDILRIPTKTDWNG